MERVDDPEVSGQSPLPPADDSHGFETLRLRQALATKMFGGAAEDAVVKIDRFTIIERLGVGGMGEVYLAHDPRLDRSIALKVMRRELHDSARDRMLREGRALARLDHPHVVPVYDVGFSDGRVFVAMGYVRGTTLRDWMTAHPCTEAEHVHRTLAVFRKAGAGLTHAHQQGVVHRDFKPDNVLVGEDGGVRVVDFGLAAAAPDAPLGTAPTSLSAITPHGPTGDTDRDLSTSRLTGDGEIIGTPAYMSPEQLVAAPIDHRSDQFSFCVALFEALHGQRPFPGKTFNALRNRVLLGDPPTTPNPVVPGWINDGLLRGLARESTARFESMQDLLAYLDDDPPARWRRRASVAAGAIGMAGVATLAYTQGRTDEPPSPCPAIDDLVGVWDDDVRAGVRSGLLGADVRFGPKTWETVAATLDQYAHTWSEMRHESCLATRVRGDQSEQTFDLREGCFAARQRAFEALVGVFREGGPEVVSRAVSTARGLPALSACGWSQAFVNPAPVPEDPTLAAAVRQSRDALAQAAATSVSGRYADGLAQARAIAETAAGIDFVPLQIEIQQVVGTAAYRVAAYDEAAVALEQAFWKAFAAGHDQELATIAARRLDVAAERQAESEVQEWEARARAGLERIGGDTRLEAAIEAAMGQLANDTSRIPEAVAHKQRAVELERGNPERDDVFLSNLISSYAASIMTQGDFDTAIEHYNEALDLLVPAVGWAHPATASVQSNLGIALLSNGDAEGALVPLTGALAVYRDVYRSGHPSLANALAVVGYIHDGRGRLELAATHTKEAMTMFGELFGPQHPKVAQVRHSLGLIRLKQRRFEDVRQLVAQAKTLYEETGETDGKKLADVDNLLGEVELAQGQYAAAITAFKAGLAHRLAQSGPKSPWLSKDYRSLARAYSASGNETLAIDNIERAIAQHANVMGPEHPRLGPLWQDRGDIERDHRRYAKAESSYSRALKILDAAGNTNVRVLAQALLGRALARRALGKPGKVDLEAAREYAAKLPEDATLHAAIETAQRERR